MKKVFKVKNLECAHCAAKMQKEIEKLDGVNSASVSFLTQKFVLDVADEKYDEIILSSRKIIKKIEPDCEIVL
ncbi:MAG: heavy-metal-associated domain-containing protein [Clostridia bacterium]|nr:heavy-metal-associated domain-containing protein [Clostridia bacterium]MBR7141548.1 heavy-metal-associated domain-containing protein [Clostridia bacterium]